MEENGKPINFITVYSPQSIQSRFITKNDGIYEMWVKNKDTVQLSFERRYYFSSGYKGIEDIQDYYRKDINVGRKDKKVNVTLYKTPERILWDSLINKELINARYIKGHTYFKNGNRMPAVSVWVEDLPFVPLNTPFYTVTDEDGRFEIAIPNRDSVQITFFDLFFSSKEQSLIITKNTADSINILMEQNNGE
ncbi:hypothetical protein D0T84_08810 [Dysgonomonas sp. 521]|nr:hypothetical protein [Dysgonomonas sp. 521]